ncbi:MAG: winged helix-turn-helix domain-containing protein [bacterium]|nr:winged helix-turn-helix domain-containing protein [bacterium]
MANTLSKLFGSKTRVKVLTLLLTDPDKSYFVREITRRLEDTINSVRRELSILEKIGLVESVEKNRKRFYMIRKSCPFYPELRALILKVGVTPEQRLIKQVESVGSIRLAVLTGVFTKHPSPRTDLLIVGNTVDKKRLERLIASLEDDINEEINYTSMSEDEFEYRQNMTDRFLKDIFDHEHLIVVNELSDSVRKKFDMLFA